jgi:hypothetical protein
MRPPLFAAAVRHTIRLRPPFLLNDEESAMSAKRLFIPAIIGLSGVTMAAVLGWAAAPKVSYLDDGVIRLGVNLDAGGAITHLSKSGDKRNLVNNWDWGRQIQMSHYSGPVPYSVAGKEPFPHWRELGWNPVQAGDHFRNPSRVMAHTNDGKSIYVKSIPMQYALDNLPADCTFECWIKLKGNTAEVRSQMTVARSDKTQYPARGQELPAVYTVGTLYRMMTYTGDRPFTGDKLIQIGRSEEEKKKFPWSGPLLNTENWAAMVDDRDWGIGIWEPGCFNISGGFFGEPGKGGTRDSQTGYICPNQVEIIDHNIVYSYKYVLIVGTLNEIRQYVYDHAKRPVPPTYRFAADRQHWHYSNAADTGWPIRDELNVQLEGNDPQLIGPAEFWQAKDAPKLRIEAACRMRRPQAAIFWKRHDDDRFTENKSRVFSLKSDGEYRVYEIDLSKSPDYRGAITGLRFDPTPGGTKGDWIKIRSISFGKPEYVEQP